MTAPRLRALLERPAFRALLRVRLVGQVSDGLLQAGLVEYADTHLPAGTDRESQAQLAGCLIALAPPELRAHIQLGVASLSETLQMVRMMGSEFAAGLLQMIVENPLVQPTGLTAPPGFQARSARVYDGFFSRSDGYVEGTGLVLGQDGAGPIDGRLLVP